VGPRARPIEASKNPTLPSPKTGRDEALLPLQQTSRLAVEAGIAHTSVSTADISVMSDQAHCFVPITSREVSMAKDKEAGVYRIVDVVGVSAESWEDAAKRAVETAAKSLRDLRIAEVTKMDVKVEDGKVVAFRTRLALSFKYEG
jgi:dodecin